MDVETEVGTVEQSTDEESLRDTLTAAFEQAGAETQGESINSDRDEGGRFKAKETAEAAPQADTATTTTTETATAVQPPASWSAEAKAEWANLPPKAQKYIAEREAEVHRGFTKLDEERNLGKSMREVLTPYMSTINALGATPTQAVQSLLNADHVLRNGNPQAKTQLISQLAHQFGVDLSAVVAGAPAPDRNVQELQQQVQQLTAFISQQQQQASQQTAASLMTEIQAFSADKPHFETLRPVMADLLQGGHAKNLQEAYDLAFRAHPTTSSQWLEAEVAKRTTSQAQANKEKVARAKSAAVSVTGAPGANNSAPRPVSGNLRDELAAQFREAGFRVN
jgi:hypothetical protein